MPTKRSPSRIAVLAAHSVLALFFVVIIVLTYIVGGLNVRQYEGRLIIFSFLHIAVAWFGTLGMFLFCRNEYSADSRIASMIFLVSTLANIFVLPEYSIATGHYLLSPNLTNRVFCFGLLYTNYLEIGAGLFMSSSNKTRTNNFLTTGLVIAIFFSYISPITSVYPSEQPIQTFSNGLFLTLTWLLFLIAILCFIICIFRDATGSTTLRSLGFMGISLGNMILLSYNALIANIIGIVLFTAGVIALLTETHTSNIWD